MKKQDVIVHVDADACIVGAGVAGAATALHLARLGLRVALVDMPRQAVASRDAAEILPPAAVHALSALRVHHAASLGETCRGVLSRWQSEDIAFTDYELLGCIPGRAVARGAVAHCLAAQAIAAGVQAITTARLRGERDRTRWLLTSATPAGGHRISCRHLIDASGRSGRPVATLPDRQHHDKAVCLSARHAASMRDPSLLLVDRSAHGWWYAIAANVGATDVAFVTDADLLPAVPDRRRWLEAEYRDANLIAAALDGTPDFSTLYARDARSSERARATATGWLAVGDAALAWDPLSGHGTRFALESAARAAEAVASGDGGDGYPEYARWCNDAVVEYRRARTSSYAAVTSIRARDQFWLRRCQSARIHQGAVRTPAQSVTASAGRQSELTRSTPAEPGADA